ncbi:MAG: DUF2955 domain-containing protein [Gemmatimonadetes bacterium]|nr:DUF2955 domain-containing protein [Gemmatimonadota bacterium]
MSAEAATVGSPILADIQVARRQAQIFRLAFGMALSAGIAFGLAWPLAFLTPVITAKLLTLPKVLPLKAGVGFIVILTGSLVIGRELLIPTLDYPFVHLLLTGLILFLLFYAKAGGTNPVLVVLLILGALVVPLAGTVSVTLAAAVTEGLIFATVVAVAMLFLTAALFPDPRVEEVSGVAPEDSPKTAGEGPESPLSPHIRAALALRSLIVLFPLAVAFQLFSLLEFSVALIMAALLSLEPDYGKHLKAGKGLILANLVGGLMAVGIYQLLVWVPSFTFFVLLVCLGGLWMGGWIFSDRLLGKLLGGGITAVFLILGPVLTGEAAAGQELLIRLGLIMGAVVYVVLAFGLLERLTRGRRLTT